MWWGTPERSTSATTFLFHFSEACFGVPGRAIIPPGTGKRGDNARRGDGK